MTGPLTVYRGTETLRRGWTTGSCAAAASQAAAILLLTGSAPAEIRLLTPGGVTFNLPVEQASLHDGEAVCVVRKDAGDDPDITNGVLISSAVRRADSGIVIDGGSGVGRVTRPGLAEPVGEAAINPGPRAQIKAALGRAAQENGYEGGFSVVISVENGEELALQTYNSHLGIIGGISILGTSGIVEPMSEKALVDTICLEMDSLYAAGQRVAFLCPGNYGADFARETLELDLECAVKCSNYIGEAFDHAVVCGYPEILLVGHAGKLVKLAAGVMNGRGRAAGDLHRACGAVRGWPRDARAAHAGGLGRCVHRAARPGGRARERDGAHSGRNGKTHCETPQGACSSGIYYVYDKIRRACAVGRRGAALRKTEEEFMKKGKLYSVGVGPGDPELLTAKAIRILSECDIVAVPQSDGGGQTALDIAAQYMKGKEIRSFAMPMTHDRTARNASHDAAADAICALIDKGKTVAFLTLGDPTVYSTAWYVHKRVAARGCEAELIPGVPSFCAAAAKLGRALCEDGEMLHIIPASHGREREGLALPGSKVLMKAGRGVLRVRDELRESGQLEQAALVERCGMEGERVICDLDELDEPSGYFSIILVKEERK